MAEQNFQVCPFHMHINEASSVLAADGKAGDIRISTMPCLGPRCLAFMQVKGEDGKAQAACSRLLSAAMLNNIAVELNTQNELKRAELEAGGVKVSDTQHPAKQ